MLQNVHRIEGNVTYITLTRGQEATINTDDLERVLQVRWYAEYVPSNDCYYARGRYQGKPIFMHRYILGDTMPDGDVQVDHINHNTLDNRRENLRWVTASENCNHRRYKRGETGLLHIHVINNKGYRHYYVTMMRNGVRKSKSYPYTPEGLQAAQDLVKKWEEDFSYDPPRTTQRHPRRSNLFTATVENGPHSERKVDEPIHAAIPNFNENDVVFVPLSRGQRAIIDKADAEKALRHRWYATPNTMDGYYAVSSGSVYMHRFLLDAPNGMYVDHINHNTLDNRRANLRLVSNQENNANRNGGAYSTSKTGIRGVSIHKGATHKSRHPLMYVFRCHCVTCKVAKYFPYTEEGLEAARVFSEAHYAAMETNQQEA